MDGGKNAGDAAEETASPRVLMTGEVLGNSSHYMQKYLTGARVRENTAAPKSQLRPYF